MQAPDVASFVIQGFWLATEAALEPQCRRALVLVHAEGDSLARGALCLGPSVPFKKRLPRGAIG
jgi:hypothetical protein